MCKLEKSTTYLRRRHLFVENITIYHRLPYEDIWSFKIYDNSFTFIRYTWYIFHSLHFFATFGCDRISWSFVLLQRYWVSFIVSFWYPTLVILPSLVIFLNSYCILRSFSEVTVYDQLFWVIVIFGFYFYIYCQFVFQSISILGFVFCRVSFPIYAIYYYVIPLLWFSWSIFMWSSNYVLLYWHVLCRIETRTHTFSLLLI